MTEEVIVVLTADPYAGSMVTTITFGHELRGWDLVLANPAALGIAVVAGLDPPLDVATNVTRTGPATAPPGPI